MTTQASMGALECLQMQALLNTTSLDCPTVQAVLSVAKIEPLDEYQRHMVQVSQLVCVISGAIILVEYFAFLPREWWILRKSRITPGIVALLINRYAGFLSIIVGALLILGNPSNCQAVGFTASIVIAVQQAASSSIFFLRTRAIWQKNKYVTAGVGLGCFVVTGCWFASAWSIKYKQLPSSILPYGGICLVGGEVATWRVISTVSTTLFDISVLILTIVGLLSYKSEPGASQNSQNFVRKLALASLFYFIPVVTLNISSIVILTALPHLRAIATTYTYAVSQIAASRLVFDMQSTFGVRDRTAETSGAFNYPTGSTGPRDDKYVLTVDDTRTQDMPAYDIELSGAEALNSAAPSPSVPVAALPYDSASSADSSLPKREK